VFARLDPIEFQQAFLSWIQAISHSTQHEIVAIDGKQLRRSHDRALGKEAIRMISAWATTNRLVLGQVKTADNSNEITAIPELLRVLDLHGCIVTIDAMGCQTNIPATIVDQGSDYVLAVKENQGRLYRDLHDLFREAKEADFRDTQHAQDRTVDEDHGRLEIRQCWTIGDPDFLDYVQDRHEWKNLRTLVMIESERRVGRKTTHG